MLDEEGNEVPEGTSGELWFERASEFSYFNNEEKTKESTSADGSMSTVGDVGYVKDGYLYLTDRSTFMITQAKRMNTRLWGGDVSISKAYLNN